jgi:hypothetical protein
MWLNYYYYCYLYFSLSFVIWFPIPTHPPHLIPIGIPSIMSCSDTKWYVVVVFHMTISLHGMISLNFESHETIEGFERWIYTHTHIYIYILTRVIQLFRIRTRTKPYIYIHYDVHYNVWTNTQHVVLHVLVQPINGMFSLKIYMKEMGSSAAHKHIIMLCLYTP